MTAAPTITTNTSPSAAVDVVGNSVTFFAAFSGTAPIHYQWQVLSGSSTNNIPGATNTSLTLGNLQLTNGASYRVQASNTTGVTYSTASALTVSSIPAPVNNIITTMSGQIGLGSSNTNFFPSWSVPPGSLIAGQLPSSVGSGNFSQYNTGTVGVLTDGSVGSFTYWPNVGGSLTEVCCGGSAGESVTYTLAGASGGYDLTNITVYGGWGDGGRDEQAYTIYYATASAPANWVELESVSFTPSDPSGIQSATRVSLYPASAPLAHAVVAVKFDFTSPPPENGFCGYSEIDVYGASTGPPPVAGTPTATPPGPVTAGTAVTLSESASGAAPLGYQWQTDNGSSPSSFVNILGATGSNYVLDTTLLGGFTMNYRVVVANSNGMATSQPVGLAVTSTNSAVSSDAVAVLRCEHLQNPLGIDVIEPRLSWEMTSTLRGDLQTAYQVLVASSVSNLQQGLGDVWNSGKVPGSQSVLVGYAGQPLVSASAYYWQARVWDAGGNPSPWSTNAVWSMGLLAATNWTGQWIGMLANTNISPAPPSPMLRKVFSVSKPVSRATAYICGLGYNELQLNGSKVGNHVLDSSFTRYDYHALYETYDVTTNLVQGSNAVGVQLANAFYNQWSSDAWNTATAPWRALPQMLFQLVIQYTDGTQATVLSDTTWKTSTGPIVLDATRLCENYDARLEQPGWSTAGFNDSAWSNAIAREGVAGQLIAPDAEPVNAMQLVTPKQIIPVAGKPGVYTFDFGQNLVGWGQLNVNGPAGTSVLMVYGEKTNSDGSVDQSNINYLVALTQYFQSDTYTLKGTGQESWEPSFTYHGFRYAQVTGLPSAPTTNTLLARVVHTAFEPAGSFLCSADLLNRIETNVMWSYIGNFAGMPTDCPTREKNGWTGDAQLACEIGLTHFHGEAAYTRWLKEFRPAQLSSGELSGVFPNANWGYGEGPAWESANLLIPWFVYQHGGDLGILTNNYVGMKAYVDYETSVATSNIVSYGLGDWEPANTQAPVSVTDTGYYYEGALIVARTAAMMGNTSDSLQYSNLAAQIYAAFNRSFYISSNSEYAGGSQTAQSCALYQGLTPSNSIAAVANALVGVVQQNNNNIDTGILGSKYILRALCDSGHSDTAFALATQTTYPSWGYQVLSGATTLWETWCGCGSQDSLNHIMFGDISAWMMEYVAGIRPGTPGYNIVLIKPELMNELASAQAVHDSPYGMISNAWQIAGQSVTMDTTIPANSSGLVYLPLLGTASSNLTILESGNTIMQNGAPSGSTANITFSHFEGTSPQDYAVWTIGSGAYQFSWQVVLQAPRGLAATGGNQQVRLFWNAVPGASSFNVKKSTVSGGPYALTANTTNLNFVDVSVTNGTVYYYVVSAISAGGESANSAQANATPVLNLNFGFETPVVSGYDYNPSGGGWTFSGASPNGSGILANGSAFGNPNAPQGVQAGFVQEHGTISQTIAGFFPGTRYTLTFEAAQRSGGNQNGGESWNVMIDSNVIASYNPGTGATSYSNYTATFVATASTHTLTFAGTDLATGDNTVFLDNISFNPPIPPVYPLVTLTSPASGAGFAAPATINLSAVVTSNGVSISGVQFVANGTNVVGEVNNTPYTFVWTNVPAGNYSVVAQAVFGGSNTVSSLASAVTVTNFVPVIQSVVPGSGVVSLSGFGQPNQPFVLQAATNLTPPAVWMPVLTNYSDGAGRFTFTNLPASLSQEFFRISAE